MEKSFIRSIAPPATEPTVRACKSLEPNCTSHLPRVESKKGCMGPPEQLIPLFFHGLMGPIEGKTYSGWLHGSRQKLGSSGRTAWRNYSVISAMHGARREIALKRTWSQKCAKSMRNEASLGPTRSSRASSKTPIS